MIWAQACAEYIRGDVVSKHAARIIQTFLVSIVGGSENSHSADNDDVDDSDVDADIPPLTFSKEGARALLNRQLTAEAQTIRKSSYRDQYSRAMQISSCLWSSDAVHTAIAKAAPAEPDGSWPAANHRQHKLDKGKKQE